MFIRAAGKGNESKTAAALFFADRGFEAWHRSEHGEDWRLYFDTAPYLEDSAAVRANGSGLFADALEAASKGGFALELVADDAAASEPAYGEIHSGEVSLCLALPQGTQYRAGEDGELSIAASVKFINGGESPVAFTSERAMPFELTVESLAGGELLILSGEKLASAKASELAPGASMAADFSIRVTGFHGNLRLTAGTVPLALPGGEGETILRTKPLAVVIV